jgi:3-hydroxyisobutyrate dehydrogenase-like beta-hydroxyacid dehydrogenase
MEKQIAWLGLGLIGLPMAARLAAAGWRVRGFDVAPERLAAARARGITPAASSAEAIEQAGLVFTSMPTEKVLIDVGRDLAAGMRAGAILVETSTVGPVASAKVAEALMARRIGYLRAPISGSVNLAESGGLTTFVSGPKASFDSAREALAAYSRAQIWLGEGEEARYAKLAINLMVAVTAGMMGETLALARKGGISWQAILDLLGESVVASPLVKYKIDALRRRDFTPTATGALLRKDLELIVEAAQQAGVPVPLARHMLAVYRAMEPALASEDFVNVVKLTERAAHLADPPSAG